MRSAEVRAVRHHGTVSVLYVTDAHGNELAIGCDWRAARDIETALEEGERPVIGYEGWQVLRGPRPLFEVVSS